MNKVSTKLQNACNGRTKRNGGLNVTEFREEIQSHLTEQISPTLRRNDLEKLCKTRILQKTLRQKKSEKTQKKTASALKHADKKPDAKVLVQSDAPDTLLDGTYMEFKSSTGKSLGVWKVDKKHKLLINSDAQYWVSGNKLMIAPDPWRSFSAVLSDEKK